MKKSIFLLAAILMASVCSAQTLDEIANKYYAANGLENLEKAQTLIIQGKTSQMGMELPLTIMVKRPAKVKVLQEYNGMKIIIAFDGEKGYMVNPLTGATDPVEIPAEQLGSVQEYNMFNDSFMKAFKEGKVTLKGEEEVEGKPAYKLAVTVADGSVTTIFIDKETFLTLKSTQTVSQMGQEMEVESYVREHKEVNGVRFGSVISQFVNGMELGGMTLEKIEIDTEIDDSVFIIQ
jgi:outer membrane lipoprotein-sorting protein